MIATNELTAKQQAVLDYIRAFRREHAYVPSIRDMMAHFGIKSPQGIACHLRALRRKGRIVWDEGLARSVRLTEPDPATELLQECADALEYLATLSGAVGYERAINLCRRIKEFIEC